MSIANPYSKNPLVEEAVILIDELDLHLHPKWQKTIVGDLKRTFPNCQFIITTHSPQVLGELQPQEIRLLNNFEISIPSQSFGLDSNSILDNVQNTSKEPLSLNSNISKKISEVSDLIEKSEFQTARKRLSELEKELHGETPETVSLWTEISLMDEAR